MKDPSASLVADAVALQLVHERFTIDSTVAGMRDCYVEVASSGG